ncbi:hypothetical protein AAKU52_002035 [Pedobacter sp. CG_S7]
MNVFYGKIVLMELIIQMQGDFFKQNQDNGLVPKSAYLEQEQLKPMIQGNADFDSFRIVKTYFDLKSELINYIDLYLSNKYKLI